MPAGRGAGGALCPRGLARPGLGPRATQSLPLSIPRAHGLRSTGAAGICRGAACLCVRHGGTSLQSAGDLLSMVAGRGPTDTVCMEPVSSVSARRSARPRARRTRSTPPARARGVWPGLGTSSLRLSLSGSPPARARGTPGTARPGAAVAVPVLVSGGHPAYAEHLRSQLGSSQSRRLGPTRSETAPLTSKRRGRRGAAAGPGLPSSESVVQVPVAEIAIPRL